MPDKSCPFARECFPEEGEGPMTLVCERTDYGPCTPLSCIILRERAMADNMLRVAVLVYAYDRDFDTEEG